MPDSGFSGFVDTSRLRIESVLETCLQEVSTHDSDLSAAMAYATLNGGKRIRPLLTYAATYAVGEITPNTDKVAAAVELAHAYSLIHDDLPAMDDDDLRRGKPTCHKSFDEAIAILAGDALQSLAFAQLSRVVTQDPGTLAQMLSLFSEAIGAPGMVGGQAFDITAVNCQLSLDELERMHRGKTGALIKASIMTGAIATEAVTAAQLQALSTYSDALGLAFQIVDDILDVESNTETLGKPQGTDSKHNKPTYASILGLEAARDRAQQLQLQAIEALSVFGNRGDYLHHLADYIVKRDY